MPAEQAALSVPAQLREEKKRESFLTFGRQASEQQRKTQSEFPTGKIAKKRKNFPFTKNENNHQRNIS